MKCAKCNSEIQPRQDYCLGCGRLTSPRLGVSYGTSWICALCGLAIVLILWTIPHSPETVTPSVPVQAARIQDDAAALVSKCGQPDKDTIVPANKKTKTSEKRWILYQHAMVKASFERSTDGWKNIGYFDMTRKKKLTPLKLTQRLPCASGRQ